ncbi:uncharacterized protein LOC134251955 [Saccostrea cucullata]|uniref:uncharacterized protein LOC134251955 n=1 Tax=Saccostrea cuccullata TaxID=36930 RepID=UPI002ED0AE11
MCWPNRYRVIWDEHESQYYNNSSKELILCDCSESPPGFTLLYLLSPTLHNEIQGACFRMKNRYYISSSKHRQIKCSSESQSSYLHGPCVSRYHGILGYDLAHCFASDIWPPSASSWIDRSHSWPPPHIVDDIVKSGCHFVAIGHKLGRHENNEWRISFSLAEQKLVYAMNHPQFLTYGLLKLFLNRVINKGLDDGDKLLCSYHMKTAVFWAIQQNMMPQWCPHTLLYCSWVCFKLILKWVYEGVCPNFFIPSNNMFLSNIHGEAQNSLFIKLHTLYKMGIQSMMETLTILSCNGCIDFMRDPDIYFCAEEDAQFSEVDFDLTLFREVDTSRGSLSASNVHGCIQNLRIIEQTMSLPLTQNQIIMRQSLTNSILQNLAFIIHINTYPQENKSTYRADKISCHILKYAAKFGCISDMLYVALYYYKTLRYMEALSIIDVIKVTLAQPYVMHNSLYVDEEMYMTALGGQSWSTKMKKAVAWDIKLNNNILYISELIPEQQSSLQNHVPCLYIPPFVMLYMLEFFCCTHVDLIRAQHALDDLQALIHYDRVEFIRPIVKNLAWQILGICQQMTGNHQSALYSYQQSLREDQLHSIQAATEMRMQTLWQ